MPTVVALIEFNSSFISAVLCCCDADADAVDAAAGDAVGKCLQYSMTASRPHDWTQ